MYFNHELRYDKKHWRRWRSVLVFNEPWRLVLKVEPNIISQVRIINPSLIKQEREMENHLMKNNLLAKMYKTVDGSYSNKNCWKNQDKMKYMSLFKTESISKLLAMENEH